MIKKCSVLLTGALSLFLLASCGSAVDKLNNSEASIYNALTQGINQFNNPQSVRILECSDIIYTDNQHPWFISSDSAHCYIRITAENSSGGTNNKVYFLLIDSTEKYDAGTMWTWDDVIDSVDSYASNDPVSAYLLSDYYEVSDYYIKSSDIVDVSKLNAALDEYMEEKGYK